MNFAVAGVNAGIMTPNEARQYMGMPNIEGANELTDKNGSSTEPKGISGTSPQDTGGGGGNQTRKMNIGK